MYHGCVEFDLADKQVRHLDEAWTGVCTCSTSQLKRGIDVLLGSANPLSTSSLIIIASMF